MERRSRRPCSGLGLSSVKSGARPAMASLRVSRISLSRVGLVALDGEQVGRAAIEQIGGQRPLGEQGVGGDSAARDVGHRIEQGDDGADLVGALLPFVGVGPHADFFLTPGCLGVVAYDAEHMSLFAIVIDGGRRMVLPVNGQGAVCRAVGLVPRPQSGIELDRVDTDQQAAHRRQAGRAVLAVAAAHAEAAAAPWG